MMSSMYCKESANLWLLKKSDTNFKTCLLFKNTFVSEEDDE